MPTARPKPPKVKDHRDVSRLRDAGKLEEATAMTRDIHQKVQDHRVWEGERDARKVKRAERKGDK